MKGAGTATAEKPRCRKQVRSPHLSVPSAATVVRVPPCQADPPAPTSTLRPDLDDQLANGIDHQLGLIYVDVVTAVLGDDVLAPG
jgi:hypothetical protein